MSPKEQNVSSPNLKLKCTNIKFQINHGALPNNIQYTFPNNNNSHQYDKQFTVINQYYYESSDNDLIENML